MIATSHAQQFATEQGGLAPLEQIRDGIWVLPTAMPGAQRKLSYTLTYLLVDGEGNVHVVDPGWESEENWRALLSALALVSPSGGVASIVATHLHLDHLAMAPRLRDRSGSPLVMHELESKIAGGQTGFELGDPVVWGVPPERCGEIETVARAAAAMHRPVTADVTVVDGERLDVAGVEIEVVHTPGHTPGSICLRLPAEKLLLTGDHVLPVTYAGIGLGGPGQGTNPIADYFRSLERVVTRDDHEVLPGHQYRFTGLAERAATIRSHHLRRSAEVGEILRASPDASVYEVASALTWSAGWQRMDQFMFYSALAQTGMHINWLRQNESTDVPLVFATTGSGDG